MHQKAIITAQPSAIHKWFWGRYFERTIRSAFFQCFINGESELSSWIHSEQKEPLILYCTHGGWWDAAAVIFLSLRTFQLDALGMMEDTQLEKYPFFRKIGMFSVNRANPRSAMESLLYCVENLQNKHRALWIFPQGMVIHQESRPVNCETGTAVLVKKLGIVHCVPVALRYDFLQEQKPEMFIRIGKPERIEWENTMNTNSLTEHFNKRLTDEWNTMRNDIITQSLNDYKVLLQGKKSMEKRVDFYMEKLAFTGIPKLITMLSKK